MTHPEPARRRPQPNRPTEPHSQQQPDVHEQQILQQPHPQRQHHVQQQDMQQPSVQQPYGQPYGQQQPYGQYPYPAAETRPRRTSLPWSGWVLLGVGALMLIGSVSPWATVHVFGDITVNGTDGDGVLTLIFAVVVAVMGVLIGVGQGRLWTSIVALIFAGLAALTGIVDIGNISSVYDGNDDISSDAVSVGFGLWLVLVAAVVGVVFSVVAMTRRT